VTESRFEAARRGITDLVGRAAESALLLDRLREAWTGAGQIALLSGEAGIGKSRLAAQLAAEVANEPHTRLRYQCSPYHRDSVLHPFVVQLGRAARLTPDDPAETQLDKLEVILRPVSLRCGNHSSCSYPATARLRPKRRSLVATGYSVPGSRRIPTDRSARSLAVNLDQPAPVALALCRR
jgi:hypothetical protein